MKHIYDFENYGLNEGLFGDLLGFFKNLFKKISLEIQKMENDPNKIKEYIASNLFNLASANNLFKPEINKFKAKNVAPNTTATNAEPNTETPANGAAVNASVINRFSDMLFEATNSALTSDDCFDLVDSILNKDSGVLGKQGIGTLFSDKSLQGDKMKVKRLTFEYIINSARDQVSKKIKYDPTKKNVERSEDGKGFKDTSNYLPSLKEIIKANEGQDLVNKVVEWVTNTVVANLVAFTKAIREDDINAAIKQGGVSDVDYKVGEIVKYKKDGFDEAISAEEQPDKVGELAIAKIQNGVFTFNKESGGQFTKTKEQIIGKGSGEEETDTTTELKTVLGAEKNNPVLMKKILDYANFLKDPNNKDKPFVEK